MSLLFTACSSVIGFALGLLVRNEAQVQVYRRWEDEWARLVWNERHRAARLEAEAAELRAALKREELALEEAKTRREATLEGETWPIN